MHYLCFIYALSMPRPCPVHASSMPRPCLGYEAIQKKCYLISEEFGINHYSLFGGFPDGAGFSLQSFLRQKSISPPIPNPLRLRGLREEAEWESLIRNFWGLGNRHASFFQPHFGRHIALGEAALLRALRGRSSREADTMVNGPCPVHSPSVPRLCLDYKAVQKCYLISEEVGGCVFPACLCH